MIRIGLTGANGQLGLCMADVARNMPDVEIIPFTREQIDLNTELSVDAVRKILEQNRCDVFVNTAAYTSVDGAENDIASAYTINEKSPRTLAAACHSMNIPFIHVSTDYVFDGTKTTPYTEGDPTNPLSVYGKSKQDGEVAIQKANPQSIIIRSAWLFSAYRQNFLKTMLELGQKKSELTIVSDQVGSPTYALDLAKAILAAVRRIVTDPRPGLFGIYHYGGDVAQSWHGFAATIFAAAHKHGIKTPAAIKPIPTSGYPLPAKRPSYSVLSSTRFQEIFNTPPSNWKAGIDDVIDKLISDKEI